MRAQTLMGKAIYFFRIGAFSLINDALQGALADQFSGSPLHGIDVERDILRPQPLLCLRATIEAGARYAPRILRNRIPPRDFFPRLPVVLNAIRRWVAINVTPSATAFTFQTQSLFDASHPELPHFLYTDHTYLANLRYDQPRPLMPVPAAWRAMESRLYRSVRVNFVSSSFAAHSIIEDYGVPSDRVCCVHSGCNIQPGGDCADPARMGRRILFVGVDWERKGGPVLIDAFAEVLRKFPDAELHIVGCAPPIDRRNVFVHGRQSPAETKRHFEMADVFCLPSRMDPSASVIAEAGAFRLPVVATAVGGNRERVVDGRTGFLCDDRSIAGQLAKLLDDGALRRQMGEAARALVMDNFTWEAVAKKIAARIRASMAHPRMGAD